LRLWVRRKRGNRKLKCSGCGLRIKEIAEVYEREVRDLPWSDGKVYWVADALFVDSDATPKKIQPNSEWLPVTLEVTWFCTSNDSTASECVREFVSGAEDTFGIDDTFETVLQFRWDGE